MPDRTTVARLLLLLAVLPALGSAAPSSYNTTLSASGALLKYSYGDCEGWCGGYNSADGCWCDHACIDIGDCCLVYESVCIVPDISSISPAEVVTAGTVDVTITGSLFGESGSVALFPSETAVTTSSWLSTEIIFSMPSGTGSGYRVRVTNNYRDSSSDPFNTAVSPPDVTIGYLAPQITDISPSSGLTSGDFDIVLTGTSFGGSVALASVTIDGSVDCPVSAASHIEITCRMPAGQGANLLVRVTVDGLESNSIGFSYDPPEITAVLPASAPTQGQTTLELQGLSLGTSGAYTTVDNQECVAISQTHDKILCTLPAGQGSSLEVRTTVADQSSNSEVFSYLPPTVSSITPASGPTSGGNQVVISGSSLGTSGIVTFGSDSCTSEVTSPCRITSHNHTHIVMTAPAGQGINVQVQVVISGEPSEELEYDYDAPVIDSVSPTTGVTQGGEELVVNGLNFGTSATVKVGGVRCPIISRTPDTQLRCRTPAGQGSNKNVVVTVFTLTSDPEPWSYSTPSVTSISPTSGSTSGGALLIVNGQNFGVSGTVSVGTFPCFPIAGQWSHTSVNCTRAEGEGRDARVRVTAGGLTSPSTAAAEFDHDAPNIDTVIPNNGPTSGSTAITLSGDNFGLTGTVTVGGLDCPISQHSHTDIVCASPIGIGKGLPIVLNLTGQETLTAGTSYDYDSPRVQSVAPSIGPTRGTTPLAISGSSFGASGGSVTVDGRACVVSSYSHSSIACALPAGEGLGNAVVVTNSLNDSSTVQGTFNYRGPTISSIAPASIATSGETITLFGSNFGIGSATVSVGGDPCLNPTVLNTDHTEMTCAAPAGSSSSVTVTTTVDGQTSSPSSLSYSRPSITDAYPAEHPTNGTTTLTIDGASFGVPPTTVGVTVDGQVCTVTSQTHLRLECDMPAGTGKSNSVRVTVGGQLASTTPSVAYMAPAISSVTPATSGTPGGEPLTLYGSNFGQSASDVRVRVGGVVATVLSATDDEVVASMPPGEGADLDVLVTVDGQEGLTGGIVSYDAPVIDMYVLEGGTASTAGGNRITINGTNFGVTAQVTIAGKECSNPVRTPHTEIICDLPSGQGRALDLTLSVGNQESTIDFDYDAPSVTSVEKATGNTNGNQVITVRGSSFGTSGSVAIGPSFVCPPVSGKWTHGAIECLLPEGQGRNLTISVTTGGQTSPETDVLFSYNAPNITGFEPASGPTSGGTLVTVTGTNFGIAGEGAVTVRIGAADCPVSFHAHTQLVCTLPPGQAGTTLDVVVASAYPDATRSGFSYSSPTIRTVAPDEGRTAGGSLLVITGTSFDQPRGSVDVGTVDCPIVSWGHSQVVCRLPAGQGTGKQVLLTTQANLTVVASIQIDYLAPVLNAVNPSNGATDGTTQLVLTGDNFGTSATVLVGGKSCVASQPQAHTNFTCTLPEGSGSNRPVVLQVDGRESETISFSYDAPYITGLEPASGSTLGNGYLLTITGTSFGDPGSLSGGANVTVGARPCPIHTHTHDNITCVTPSGEGSLVPVLITIDSQVSASSVLYNYLPPTITQVRPIVAGTAGGTTITVEGTNFGVGTGIVQIGGATCTVLTYDHTEVTCRLPAGEGRNKQVVISVSSRTATAVDRFHYKAPNVTAVTPNEGFTSGSDLIEIVGSDFGLNPLVTIGGLTCSPTTKSHTRIQCRTPRGQGRDLALVVTAASQTSAATPANFSYFAPTIALTPLEGPTQGKIRLTLRGTSFGQGGQISVNNVGCPIVPGSYSHVEVMCTLPAGQGVDLNVTLTVAGQVSNMQQFTYSDPEVLGLAPDPGPTAGSVLLTITGINFGTSGSVLVGGAPCTLGTGTVYRHTRIECVLPEGSGVSNDVVVSVARDSQPVNYRYSAPQLTSIEPLNGPTLGGTNVTLHGSNFGCVGSSTSQITVAWGTLTPSATLVSCTHSTIVFELPERVEISTSVAVTVDGQQSNALGTFSYDAPEITRVSGCNGDTATAAADCPIDGLVSEGVPVVITVTGTNFGPSGTAALEIDGVACAAPTYGAAHAEVLCDLPQGVGSDIPVTVTVDGKSDTANLLSYAGPEFAAGSTNVTDALVAGGTSLQFDAKFVGSDSSRVAITYAPADGSFPDVVYNCTITGFVVVDADTRTVTCTMDAGVGQDLVLSITVDEDGFPPLVSAASYFTVSYAAPTLTADTLKSNSGPETNDLVGTESEGQIVLFRGTNFGDDEDLLSVRYGTEEDLNAGTGSSIKTCGDVQLQDGNTQIRCRTQPGDGGPFVFQVTALNQDSAVGSDTYSYPQVPIVYAVTGCSPHGSIANATADCDTEGDTEITIVGSKFGADSLSIKVGDGDCTDVQFIDSTELRCRTPEGAGLDQIVVVVVGVLFSEGHELLSYKVPVLESVTADSGTGCLADPDNAANLIECPREGGATLTITGTSLGPPSAIVIVGSSRCEDTVHSAGAHTEVTCTLPEGTGEDLDVFFVQANGESAAVTLTVSYAPCEAGEYADGAEGSTLCLQCEPGSFTAQRGEVECQQCEAGTFAAAAGAVECDRCARGNFSVRSGSGADVRGASECERCAAGSFAASAGQPACNTCPAGRYSGEGAHSCTRCAAGRFASSSGLSSCESCSPGSYSQEGALRCDPCAPGSFSDGTAPCQSCAVGRSQSASGQSSCDECPLGTATARTGQTRCLPCDSGSFANTTELDVCFVCPAGSFSVKAVGAAQGATECTDCPTGRYIGVAGQGLCLQCNKGSFAITDGQTECEACEAGYFAETIGQDECEPCAIGRFANGEGSARCLQCEVGRATPSTASISCPLCDEGKYQPARGQSECIECGLDTVARARGQSNCRACPVGSYADALGSSSCTECVAGWFKSAGSPVGTCEQCAAGRFSSSAGQSECQACDVGRYGPSQQLTACEDCEVGKHTGSSGQTECLSCAEGTFAGGLGSLACKACPPGSVNTATGLSECSECDRGFYQPLSGESECQACEPGTYNPSKNQRQCLVCPVGRFSNESSATFCIECPLGTFQDSVGKTRCQECDPGKFASAEGQANCASCSLGKHQAQSRASSCDPCGPGTISTVLGSVDCTDCATGRFSSGSGQIQCKRCGVGTFNTGVRQSECTQCPIGTYQDQIGQTECRNCSAGEYAPGEGEIRCLPCPVGHFRTNTSTRGWECNECPTGKFQDVGGSTGCKSCPAGRFSASNASVSCEPCPSGQFNPNPTQTSCQRCPVGQYQPNAGSPDCELCPEGSATSSEGQARCVDCASGRYANDTGLDTCRTCPEGKYSAQRATDCLECPTGRYQPVIGQDACEPCEAGTYSDRTGMSTCIPCPAGFAQDSSAATECTPCVEGSVSSGLGSPVCQTCGVGKYQPQQNATACLDCDVGSVQPLTGQASCNPCPRGQYSPVSGQDKCLSCAIGSFGNVTGLDQCTLCREGYYYPSSGGTACLACTQGTFTDAVGQGACIECPLGSYSNELAATECTPCPLGTFADSSAQTRCENCTAGRVAASEGTVNCRQCNIGRYVPNERQSECLPCASGSYQPNTGQTECLPCASGSYAPGQGETTCLLCPAGEFSSGSASRDSADACEQCEPGKFTNQAGRSECLSCAAGRFANNNASTVCTPCPPGTFAGEGAAECTPCARGSAQQSAGATSCKLCSAGSVVNSTGQQSCNICPKGRYAPGEGGTECFPCAPGNFTNIQGSSACKVCPAGSVAAAEAQEVCLLCSPGSFASDPGLQTCTACEEGKYSDRVGLDACIDCPAGQSAPGKGSKSCTACRLGRYAETAGQPSCDPCPIGTHQPNEGQPSCEPCLTGSFGLTTGASSCGICAPGTFSNDSGLQDCQDCPSGRYAPEAAMRECLPCPSGSFISSTGQVSCEPCPLGSAASEPGSPFCPPCRAGKFQNRLGQHNCTDCPAGKFSSSRGEVECRGCPVGSFSGTPGSVGCTLCPAGRFEVATNSTECDACPKGRFVSVQGSVVCHGCKVGTYAEVEALPTCRSCDEGTFQNETAKTECYDCPRGSFADNQGESACKECRPGSYGPDVKLDACPSCPPGRATDQFGRLECAECGAFEFAESPGQLRCEACPQGRFGNSSGQAECYECAPGRANVLFGQAACTDCTVGEFTDRPGQIVCQACAPGRASNETGQRSCPACELGRFQPLTNQTTCVACAAGRFAEAEGQIECEACQPGTFGADEGQSECEVCPIGWYSQEANATECVRCDVGQFSRQNGSRECDLCEPGRFANTTGTQECTVCEPGRFASAPGSESCVDCAAGRHASLSAAFFCDKCPAGRADSRTGVVDCAECASGKFQSVAGRQQCTDCTPGRYTSRTGRSVCRQCEVRTFAANPGQGTCELCPLGYAQNQTGQASCKPCKAGTVARQIGLEFCSACKPGFFTSTAARSVCTACAAGKYSATPGSTVCQDCARGRYAIAGSSSCLFCAQGTFAPDPGMPACTLCPTGKISTSTSAQSCVNCTKGRFAEISGQSVCRACQAGRFALGAGAANCVDCAPGLYAPLQGATGCQSCPLGQYAPQSGSQQCQQCPRGRFGNGSALTSCFPCEPGRFASVEASQECEDCPPGFAALGASAACRQCAVGQVAPSPRTTICTPCDSKSTSNDERNKCICKQGYYAVTGAATFALCRACPDGADCEQRGTVFETMTSETGWWRSNTDTLSFHRCLREIHCEGGRNSTCAAHRINPLCAICQDGYHSYFGGACVACPKRNLAWVFVVFVALAIVLVYIAMLWVIIRGGEDMLKQEIERIQRDAERDENMAGYGLGGWEEALHEREEQEAEERAVIRLNKRYQIQRPAEFMFKMKIMVGFLQVISNLAISLEIPWPTAFKRFVSFFSFANIDFLEASSVGCVADTSFYNKFVIMGVSPLVIGVLVAVFYLMPKYIVANRRIAGQTRVDMQRDLTTTEERVLRLERKKSRRNAWKMLIFTLFLIYPVVSSTVLRLYVCKRIDGVDYLLADFRKECFTDEWYQYAAIGALFIIVYPIGIPVFFFGMIWRYRRKGRLHEFGVLAQLGLLYDAYDSTIWWFEMLDMAHKLIVTSLLAFLPDDAQLPTGLFIVLGYAIAILLLKPYKRKGDDALHLLVQVELALMIYAGYMFYLDIDITDTTELTLAIVLIGLCVFIFLYFMSQFFRMLHRWYDEWKVKRAAYDGEGGESRAVFRGQDSHQAALELQRSNLRTRRKTVSAPVEGERVQMRLNPISRLSIANADPQGGSLVTLANNPAFAGGDGEVVQAIAKKRHSIMASPALEMDGEEEMETNELFMGGELLSDAGSDKDSAQL